MRLAFATSRLEYGYDFPKYNTPFDGKTMEATGSSGQEITDRPVCFCLRLVIRKYPVTDYEDDSDEGQTREASSEVVMKAKVFLD